MSGVRVPPSGTLRNAPKVHECPRSSIGTHQTYGGSVCALCGHQAPSAPPEPVVNPQAFRDGERLAYDRVLQFLATLPEEAATRTRDEGRGAAFVVRGLTAYVTTLREDLGDE